MRRRVLFVIRDKFGDSLLAFAIVQAYLALHPDDEVTVLMRSDYADLVCAEPGFALVRYRNALQAMLWALRHRLFGKPFDALVVLRGFGPRVRRLGRLIRARRKINLDGRLAPEFPEWPAPLDDAAQETFPLPLASYRAAALYEPALEMPQKLHIPSLSRLRIDGGADFVGVCPVTDEKRKDLSQQSLEMLLEHIARTEPGVPVKILVRKDAERLYTVAGRSGCELVNYGTLSKLTTYFARMKAYYGADSGLYHFAAAMDIPCAVVFGPTQPKRIVLPRQRAQSIRLAVLRDRHCGVISCRRPVCIDQALANLAGSGPQSLEGAPAACPLRASAGEDLLKNEVLRFPMESAKT